MRCHWMGLDNNRLILAEYRFSELKERSAEDTQTERKRAK